MNNKQQVNHKRSIFESFPFWAGITALFFAAVLVYIFTASEDCVYTDHIRLINSYLPDIYNPDKFFVADILTRTPIAYLFRIINTELFHYSIHFDRVVGAACLFISSLILVWTCIKSRIKPVFIFLILILCFSLSKREMYLNGSGYVHFMSYIPFFLHFSIINRLVKEKPANGTVAWLCIIPFIAIIFITGPYCATYVVTILILYVIIMLKNKNICRKTWVLLYSSIIIPFIMYMISNSFAVEDIVGAKDITLLEVLTQNFGFVIRFNLNGFASSIIGGDALDTIISEGTVSNGFAYALGTILIIGYAVALYIYIKEKMFNRTIVPLAMLIMGFGNHMIVFVGRYIFLREDYSWSSRYFLQYQVGIIGILMILGLSWSMKQELGYRKTKDSFWYRHSRNILGIVSAIILIGNIYSTVYEIKDIPNRKFLFQAMKEIELNYELVDDSTLDAMYEYRHGADLIRKAFKTLQDNNLNIFHKEQ